MDETNGRDGESFHRNEAISAVADEAFLGEEDDDDYEDLYNDVNVGDGFLQSVKKNESLPDPEPENVPKGVESVPESVSERARKFGDGGNEGNEGLGRVVASEGVGLGSGLGNVANKGDLGQFSVKVNEGENRSMGNMNGMSNINNMNNLNSNDNGMGIVGPGPQQNYHNPGGNTGNVGGGGGTILFVGDLHWWTTDAELEAELCKYGHVKEVKFFDEKASGKSKGYCQVEFYDSAAAAACKEGMNGHVFNGRPCVVAFASPFSVKRMGEAQVNRTQQTAQPGQMKRGPGGPGEGPVKPGVPGGGNNMNMAPAANFQGSGDNRGYGRANWGRNNGGGMMGRARPMGGRARPMMGNGYGPPPMMHPQSMMGQGFDPSFNGPMNRMGNYGFPGGPTPPFSGMMPSFPPVGNVGVPGLTPHVNPAFFGRGMPMNGMGMMQSGGPDGPNMGMWSDPNMPGWAGDEHGGRVGESSYGEEAGYDQQYGEGKEKERDWSGTSDRRVRDDRDDREQGYERDIPREKETVHEEEWPEKRHRERDRDRERERERERERSRDRDRDRERSRDHHRYREEKDRYADHHRHRDAEPEYDEEWDRSRSSRAHAKSRTSHKDEHRSRSKDSDYGKRRRVTAE